MADQALAITSPILPTKPIDAVALEKVLIGGDLAVLSEAQRIQYYHAVCDSVGLNELTKPFEYLYLNKKLVLYANKSCTDQLRQIHKISLKIVAREKVGDCYVVTARARDHDGREDESTGVVALSKAYGEQLANLYMKAETKAKRRVTLSICGLGLLDESEVETIPSAQRVPSDSAQSPVARIQAGEPDEIKSDSTDEPLVETPPDDFQGRESAPGRNAEGQKITEGQVRRLFAIAHGKGWKNPQIKRLLKSYLYEASADVLLRDYEEICDKFGKVNANEYDEDPVFEGEIEWPK